jgi:glucosamine--fructose-6-phosphate aminotransferase (isomerizing)
LAVDWSPALEPLAAAQCPFVVGRGLGFGTAREMALKFKELCGLHAEAISGAEIMHGPKALIGPDDPVLVLAPDDRARSVMEDCAATLGQQTAGLIVAGRPTEGAALSLSLPDAPLPDLANLVLSTASYPFIGALARARGLDPDQPRHIRKVTETR